jgi:uncharacterized membrane protein YeiH
LLLNTDTVFWIADTRYLLLGAGSYAGLSLLPTTQGLALPLAMCLALLLRGAAISFELRLPKFGR